MKEEVKYFFKKLGITWIKRIVVLVMVGLFSCIFYNGLLANDTFGVLLGGTQVFQPCYSLKVWGLLGLFVTAVCDFFNPYWLTLMSYSFLITEAIYLAVIGGLILLLA